MKLLRFGKFIHKSVIALWITFAQPHKNGVESLSLEPILFSSRHANNILLTSVLVTVKTTQEAITKGEDHSDTLPAILTGVARDRERIFIECVHAKRLPPTTDMKPGDFYMLS
jgi:hypothetical protein